MIKKMRVATVLQPFASGYFSNSNIVEGTESLYKAYRTLVWQNTDADRCGILPFVFEDDFSFERYVDYLLDVPMYFVKRGDQYFDKAGANFKNFINGTLEQFSDHEATMKDFEDQVSIVFPEVRLKKFLEVRGADSGNLDHIMKVTQFWVDLLYNDEKLDECFEIIKNWSFDEIFKLYKNIPREGSQSIFRDKNINQWVEFFQNL
jgi:glutamate--cysteine ligase